MTGEAFRSSSARVPAVIEHRESRAGRVLRRNRVVVAAAIAAVEGILVISGALQWWIVLALAAVALAVYLAAGRDSKVPEVRSATWVAAVSQLLVVLVPVLAAVVAFLAIAVVIVLAIAALVALLLDRR
jgi:hypothetical protein